MLVSQTEALAQELRRQDLLTHALREQAALDQRRPGTHNPVLPSPIRRAVGAVLIRAGTRLKGLPRLEPTVESAASTPPA